MAGFQIKKFKKDNGISTQDFLSSVEREVEGSACSNQGRDHTLCFVPTQEASWRGWVG